jgi:hypothetical protein
MQINKVANFTVRPESPITEKLNQYLRKKLESTALHPFLGLLYHFGGEQESLRV